MNVNSAFLLGSAHRLLEKSIYYNPFVHKGTAEEYTNWESGWKETEKWLRTNSKITTNTNIAFERSNYA